MDVKDAFGLFEKIFDNMTCVGLHCCNCEYDDANGCIWNRMQDLYSLYLRNISIPKKIEYEGRTYVLKE